MNVNDFDKKIIRIKDTDGKIFTGEASSISAKYVCNHRVGINNISPQAPILKGLRGFFLFFGPVLVPIIRL